MVALTKKAVIENLNPFINQILDEISDSVVLQKKKCNMIRVLCEELLVNIIRYAYEEAGDMTVEAAVNKEERIICLCFIDDGMEFNPLDWKKPDITADIMERPVGGLGIFIVREIADSLNYERVENCNKLTVTILYQPEEEVKVIRKALSTIDFAKKEMTYKNEK